MTGGYTTAEALRKGEMFTDDGTTCVVISNESMPCQIRRLELAVVADVEFPDNESRRVVLDLPGQHEIAGVHLAEQFDTARLQVLHDAIEGIGKPMSRRVTVVDEDDVAETTLRVCGVDIAAGSMVVAYAERWSIKSVQRTGAQPVVIGQQVLSDGGLAHPKPLQPGAISEVYGP